MAVEMFQDQWSEGDWALAILPKISAGIAIPCSLFTIFEILNDTNRKGPGVIKRSILGMTIIDIGSSLAWFVSSWAVPQGTFPLSTGNRTTCNFQGFLLQLAIGAPLYNCTLAMYFLLMLKYRWTEKQLLIVERWAHLGILGFSLGTSILFLSLELYNPTGQICWVIGDPVNCSGSAFHSTDIPCERGVNAWILGVTLFYGPLWLCIILCVISMIVIYRVVSNTNRRMNRYTLGNHRTHSLGRSSNDSSRVATQAILYSLAFLVTWMPSTLWSLSRWFNWSHITLSLAAAFCEPLQGFWNLFVFARTRNSTKRKIRNLLRKIVPCVGKGIENQNMGSFSSDRQRNNSRVPLELPNGSSIRCNDCGRENEGEGKSLRFESISISRFSLFVFVMKGSRAMKRSEMKIDTCQVISFRPEKFRYNIFII
jgi:hypothetical protein